MFAAVRGHTPCAQALIEAKADLNAKTVSYSCLCTRSAALISVQHIQNAQTRSKTPSLRARVSRSVVV
jgi:hypothetical protein